LCIEIAKEKRALKTCFFIAERHSANIEWGAIKYSQSVNQIKAFNNFSIVLKF